ncbi:unnamed protein product [Trichogramma brassicae]|uniref:Uncharacterized protein n=2 Tax=Apocrita TaxID=7400 RepID=A0A6H5HWT6_9HYME|nr:unnamed protein product [Trichogramma brassicae]
MSMLEQLQSLVRKEVNLENEDVGLSYYGEIFELVRVWQNPPDLREIFRPEEIDRFLTDMMNFFRLLLDWQPQESRTRSFVHRVRFIYGPREPTLKTIVSFVARSGLKDEPSLDRDGRLVTRRTTALHHAVRCNLQFVRCLIYDGIISDLFTIYDKFHVNYVDEFGLTHLHAACRFGRRDIAEKFLELGADASCVERSTGFSTLHYALQSNERRCLFDLLMKNGANPNLADSEGRTALHVICERMRNDWFMAKMVVELCDEKHRPLQIDALDKWNNTPLNLALKGEHEHVAELLLKNGADPNLTDFPEEIIERIYIEKIISIAYNRGKEIHRIVCVSISVVERGRRQRRRRRQPGCIVMKIMKISWRSENNTYLVSKRSDASPLPHVAQGFRTLSRLRRKLVRANTTAAATGVVVSELEDHRRRENNKEEKEAEEEQRATTWSNRRSWRRSEYRRRGRAATMPAASGIGASYRSLGDLGEDVYKSTTVADNNSGGGGGGGTTTASVLESVKKAFSFAAPAVMKVDFAQGRKKEPLIEEQQRRETISIVSRDKAKMPTAASAEESALLGARNSMGWRRKKRAESTLSIFRPLRKDVKANMNSNEPKIYSLPFLRLTHKQRHAVGQYGRHRAEEHPAAVPGPEVPVEGRRLGARGASGDRQGLSRGRRPGQSCETCHYHLRVPDDGRARGAAALRDGPLQAAQRHRLRGRRRRQRAGALRPGPPGQGQRPVPHQLRLDAGRLDRVGLPEVELSPSALPGHDPGRPRLSHVASFRQGHRRAQSRPRAGLQELLRAARQSDESGPVHRQLRAPHRSQHRARARSHPQEGQHDPERAGDEHHGLAESPRRGHGDAQRTPRSHQQFVDEGTRTRFFKFFFRETNSSSLCARSFGECSLLQISDCGMVLEEQPGKVSEAFRLFLQGEGYVKTLFTDLSFYFPRVSDRSSVPNCSGRLSTASTTPEAHKTLRKNKEKIFVNSSFFTHTEQNRDQRLPAKNSQQQEQRHLQVLTHNNNDDVYGGPRYNSREARGIRRSSGVGQRWRLAAAIYYYGIQANAGLTPRGSFYYIYIYISDETDVKRVYLYIKRIPI